METFCETCGKPEPQIIKHDDSFVHEFGVEKDIWWGTKCCDSWVVNAEGVPYTHYQLLDE